MSRGVPRSCSVHGNRWRSAWPSLLLCLLSRQLWAADLPIAPYAIDTWTTADGLPQNSVTAIAQTTDGYLWLGTFNGLVRFDGATFTVFSSAETPGLTDQINGLHADSKGRLWIVDALGYTTRMEAGQFIPTDLPRDWYDRWEDKDGTFWLARVQGQRAHYRWDEDKARFTLMPLPAGSPTDVPARIAPDRRGQFWAMTHTQFGPLVDGQFRVLLNTQFYDHVIRRLGAPQDDCKFWPFPHKDEGCWVKRTNGMDQLQVNGERGASIEFPVSIRPAHAPMFEDTRGNFWFVNGGELLRRSPDGAWSRLTAAQGIFPRFRRFYEDREGSLWLGTDGGGLQRLRPLPFKSYDDQHGLKELSMNSITEDTEGGVWVATYGEGLKKMEGDRFVTVYPSVMERFVSVDTVLASSQGGVWIIEDKNLHLIRGTNVFAYRLQVPGTHSTDRSWSILEDRRGRLWIGHSHGAVCMDNGGRTFFQSPKGAIRCLAEGTGDTMWFGSSGGGLGRLNNGQLTAFTTRDGLPADSISSIVADPDGTVWIATPRGLSRYRDGKFLNCSVEDGLPDRTIQCLLDDGLGWLWMTSYRGIIRVARSELESFFSGRSVRKADTPVRPSGADRLWCDLYGERDGLESRESQGGRQPMAWKGRDGRLWFLNLKGVAVVDPKTIPQNRVPPPMVIQEVRVDGKPQPGVRNADTPVRLSGSDRNADTPVRQPVMRTEVSAFRDGFGAVRTPRPAATNHARPAVLSTPPVDSGVASQPITRPSVTFATLPAADKSVRVTRDRKADTLVRSGERATTGVAPYQTEKSARAVPSEPLPVARWNLGEQDSGAKAGGPGNAWTRDAHNINDLEIIGTPRPIYSISVPAGGSTLSMSFNGSSFYQGSGAGVSHLYRSLDFDNCSISCDVYPTALGKEGFSFPFSVGGNETGFAVHEKNGRWVLINHNVGYSHQSAPVVLNAWTHLEVVRRDFGSGTQARLFTNGVDSGVSISSWPNPPADCFMIGANRIAYGPEGYFHGQIDNVVLKSGEWQRKADTPARRTADADRSVRLTTQATADKSVRITAHSQEQQAATAALIVPLKELTIPPGKQRLEITYAALSYVQPQRNRYKYRLHGFDKNWIDAGHVRTAEYTALPPGRYRFEVTGANNDGLWSESAASLALVFQPFYWQTTWFKVLAILAGLGGFGGLLRQLERRKVRRKLAEMERQLAVNRERGRIARDIHDDLGARLTQIGLLTELARRPAATPEETLRQVEKIADRTRTTVQAMDEIVWAADPSKDTLDNLALYLAGLMQELFEDATMRYQFDMPDNLPRHPLSAEVRHSLVLAVKESLNNALKHSAATEVSLRLAVERGFLRITVADNGKGFDRAQTNGEHNGLANIEQRLRSLGGEFALESRLGAGTRITLRLRLP